MKTREIGNDTTGRVQVGAIGLGLMTFDQSGTQPRQQLLDTVTAALEAGVTLFDTADAYGYGDDGSDAQGQNERLVAGLLDELGVRDQVLLATKGGHVRTEGGDWATDSSRGHLVAAVDASLERLGSRAARAVAAPPARPRRPLRGGRGHAARDRRVRQGADDRALQRRPRADPARALGAGRPPGQRAEPVLAEVPLQPARDRRLRGAGTGVPALEPAGWSGRCQGAGRAAPGVRGDRPRTAVSAPSRSRWPGSSRSRRASYPSRERSVPSRSPTRLRPPTSSSRPTSCPGSTPTEVYGRGQPRPKTCTQ